MTSQQEAFSAAAVWRDALQSATASSSEFAASIEQGMPALQRFLSAHDLATTAAAATNGSISEQDQELRAAVQHQGSCISQLISRLESSIEGLRSTLDASHKLLEVPATTVDPSVVVSYAFRLRHHFYPLGATPGLPAVPPAPQPPFMLASNLNQFNAGQHKALEAAAAEELARQQAEARRTALMLSLMPADWAPGDPIPPHVIAALEAAEGQQDPAAAAASAQQQQQQPQAAGAGPAAAPAGPAAAAAAPAPPAPALIDFGLNADLGEEVEEEWSDEDSDF